MVPQTNLAGVKAAAGFAAENLLLFPAASGAGRESIPGLVSLWTAIWLQHQDAGFSASPPDAGTESQQALGTGSLKPAGRGESTGTSDEPEAESELFPSMAVCTPAHPPELLRPSEWALTGPTGPVGLLLETASESPDSVAPVLSGLGEKSLPVAADASFGPLPQLAVADQAGQGFLAAADAPAIPEREAAPESGSLKADAGLPDNLRLSQPAPLRHLATELVLHRKSINDSLPESACVQPEQSLAPAGPLAGKAEIAPGVETGPIPGPLLRAAAEDGAVRRTAGQGILAPPSVLPQAATPEPGHPQGSMNRRGNAEPQTGFETSGSTSPSYGSEEVPKDSADRSDGQAAHPESGGRPIPDAAIGSPGSVKGGGASARPQQSLTAGGEPDSVPAATVDPRIEAPQTESVRRQLHVAVEGPEGARVDLRLLHTPGALHIRLASSREALAEALRAEQYQLEQALHRAGWDATAGRPEATHSGDSLVDAREGLRQLSAARLAEAAAIPTPEIFNGSHNLMDGGAGRGRQHMASELRQEWLDLSALRRFARQGGQTSK